MGHEKTIPKKRCQKGGEKGNGAGAMVAKCQVGETPRVGQSAIVGLIHKRETVYTYIYIYVDVNNAPMHGQTAFYRILNKVRVKDKVTREASCSGGSGHAYLRTLTTREEAQTSSVTQGKRTRPTSAD